MRKGVQLLCAAFFAVLLLASAHPFLFVAPDVFLQASPLLALSAALAARTFSILLVPSLVLLATAVLAGRIFCAWVCPLGTLFGLCGKKQPQPGRLHYPAVKYMLLLALFCAALAGLNLAGLIGLFVAGVVAPEFDVVGLDGSLGQIAEILSLIFAFIMQNWVSKGTHSVFSKGSVPVIGTCRRQP